jgi:phosphoglycolate phosphatase-like HAD superfamily hydrolase
MHICLFDIDGTLLNSGGAGQAAMEAAIREELGTDEPIHGVSYAGRTDRAIIGDIFAFYGVELTDTVKERFVATYLRHLPRELAGRPGLILPGVAEMLSHLHHREDVTLGLLTGNLLEGARVKLEHHGLAEYFDFALGAFGDEHLDRDDVARAAWAAMRAHHRHVERLTPDRVWVIGDTPADVRCGRAIGAKVLAVATGVYSIEQLAGAGPDKLVKDFADAEAVLELWM